MKAGRNLHWWMVDLLTLGTILNYLARSTLSVAAPARKAEFGLLTEQYSWVVLMFRAAYTVMQTGTGVILGALGTRGGFFLFTVGWALVNMAHGRASGWPSLALFRGLLGASEAARIPAGAKPCRTVSAKSTTLGYRSLSDGRQFWQYDYGAAGR